MCILFIAIGQHPQYPLVIAANRDEFHNRPSQPMHHWETPAGITAGRDLQAGGTWLGVNSNGRFAAVTNFRTSDAPDKDALSRGNLVVDALSQTRPATNSTGSAFDQHLDLQHHRYSPFNLVYGDAGGLQAWDYRASARRQLPPGFHSVSNGPIDEPWPKMAHGVAEIAKMISHKDDLDLAMLNQTMQDQTKAPLSQLPETGISAAREQALSSIFIEGPVYGTRTTTVLLFDFEKISILETNYGADTSVTSASQHTVTFDHLQMRKKQA